MEISCNWCHTLNEIKGLPWGDFCSNCGHRADLPRTECDCDECNLGIMFRRSWLQQMIDETPEWFDESDPHSDPLGGY